MLWWCTLVCSGTVSQSAGCICSRYVLAFGAVRMVVVWKGGIGVRDVRTVIHGTASVVLLDRVQRTSGRLVHCSEECSAMLFEYSRVYTWYWYSTCPYGLMDFSLLLIECASIHKPFTIILV